MASSYNLRMRQKQLSPASKKQNGECHEDPSKESPKTAHKGGDKIMQTPNSSSKLISVSSTLTGTINDLHTGSITNNQIFNAEMNSNSQLDSLINNISILEKKNKIDQVDAQKQEDGADSVLLDESGLFGRVGPGKGLRRYYSHMEIETDKKEYRAMKHPAVLGVPFRKFQSHLEEKIVSVINKMKQQKNCAREIQKLFAKIQNAPNKDLKNKYFVSGIAIILKLMSSPEQSKFYPSQFQSQSEISFRNLKKRIQSQILDKIQDFEYEYQDNSLTIFIDKPKLINRVFKILRRKQNLKNRYKMTIYERQSLQNKSISLVDQFQLTKTADVKLLFQKLGQM